MDGFIETNKRIDEVIQRLVKLEEDIKNNENKNILLPIFIIIIISLVIFAIIKFKLLKL